MNRAWGTRVIACASYKGGAGKTTVAFHLASAAAEQGLRVLAVDTDEQGDLYRRLAGLHEQPEERPGVPWVPGCLCVYSPGGWEMPAGPFDVVIIDTPRDKGVPPGPCPHVVVIPIDGIDAALNANDVIARALAAGVRLIVPVRNGTAEGGPRYAREFRDLGEGGLDRVQVCPADLPRSGSIRRTDLTCKPAWKELRKDTGAAAILRACTWVLSQEAA